MGFDDADKGEKGSVTAPMIMPQMVEPISNNNNNNNNGINGAPLYNQPPMFPPYGSPYGIPPLPQLVPQDIQPGNSLQGPLLGVQFYPMQNPGGAPLPPPVGRALGTSSDMGIGVVLSMCLGWLAYVALAFKRTTHKMIYGIHLGNGILWLAVGLIMLGLALPIAATSWDEDACKRGFSNNNNNSESGRPMGPGGRNNGPDNDGDNIYCRSPVVALAIVGSFFLILGVIFLVLARKKQRFIADAIMKLGLNNGGLLPLNASQIYF